MEKTTLSLCIALMFAKGAFALATEPAAQPTNLQFAAVKAYSMVMSFTTTTADGYLILKSDQPVNDIPTDGVVYEKGQGLTTCKVISTGSSNILSVREILENTTYYFKVFAYNGSGADINYLQTNPLGGSVTSAASDAGNYYASVDSGSGTFVSDLHNLINIHTVLAYSGYKSTIIPAIFERDTTGGQVVINCEYSNETTLYTPPFDFTAQAYNREHTLCKSWMQTAALYGASNLINYAEGSDYYNLLLTRSTPNQIRSNHPEGVVLNATSTYGESKYGMDINGMPVFEPWSNRKGDAARAMMYEMICYNGLNGGWGLNQLLSEATNQNQDVLKLWNQQDPPDKFERTKNEYISSLQQNRNPFIDHPSWADCINFDSIIKTSFCGAISGINEADLGSSVSLYPNPAYQILLIEMNGATSDLTEINLYNTTGALVSATRELLVNGLDISQLPTGVYIAEIKTRNGSFKKRWVKM